MGTGSIGPAAVGESLARIRPFVRLTPALDLGAVLAPEWRLVLKLEHTQLTGSFKARGAFNLILQERQASHVVAASGGNFGKAVAYAAHALGLAATIFVPDTSPEEKKGQITRFGARLEVIPGFYDEALSASREFVERRGGLFAHAYDDDRVMAGQGTVGLEVEQQVPECSMLLVAVGGGGLIGGIASHFGDAIRLVGVESEGCPALHAARSAGRPVEVDVGGIAASSLGARAIGERPWSANRWIDDSVLVTDEAIIEAQAWLWDTCRLWVEPAAAAPIAALRTGEVHPGPGDTVVAVLSGGNLALEPPDR